MSDAPRTVTLPLVWRENSEDDWTLLLGTVYVGGVFLHEDDWIVRSDSRVRRNRLTYPTRAAAMAALEEAVCGIRSHDAQPRLQPRLTLTQV